MTNNFKWLVFSSQPLTITKLIDEAAERGLKVSEAFTEQKKSLAFYSYAAVLELTIPANLERSEFKTLIDGLSQSFRFDYCLFDENYSIEPIRLAVFDMDSTLIPMEVIDELAAEAGVKEQVAAITESAMRGELDFNQSFEQRLCLLSGMPKSAVKAVQERLTFNQGVEILIQHLVEQGAVVGIASGGFKPFAEVLAARSPISRIRSNQLQFDEHGLTGKAIQPIVNAEVKAQQVLEWQKELNISKEAVLAVGDGANDSNMLEVAGLGVAYKAKPFLRQNADCVIQYGEMNGLIDVLNLAM